MLRQIEGSRAVAGIGQCRKLRKGGLEVSDLILVTSGVVAGVDDVGELLSPRDGQKLFPYIS